MKLSQLLKASNQIKPNHSILLYGPPKTGKTQLVGTAAKIKEFDKIVWIDLENGSETLLHMGLKPEELEKIELIRHCGIDFDTWLEGFDCVESSVKDSVEMLRKHPLIPKDVKISGYVMDSVTGELHVVEP